MTERNNPAYAKSRSLPENSLTIDVGEQAGEQADGRQPGAELIDEDDAGYLRLAFGMGGIGAAVLGRIAVVSPSAR